ncbi:hypothetical protein QM012_000574 [Aureobasidium pullulans]|uniref:Uncharacterized protein n=1 Tax=Aureobasidium pullulans TaxID=5580 RepID=A0ABR0TVZ6_AURPU
MSMIYIGTVIMVQPYWIAEIAANFLYFNNINHKIFEHTRPFEALFRDPWWIFTILNLVYNIKKRYDFGFIELVRISPRFGVLLVVMTLSVLFLFVDILSVTHVIPSKGLPDGINPFWKLSFIFKCMTDTVILDDFKTALDKMKDYRLRRVTSYVDNYDHAERGSTEPITVRTTVTQHEHYENRMRNFDDSSMAGKDWATRSHIEQVELEEVTPPPTVRTQIG